MSQVNNFDEDIVDIIRRYGIYDTDNNGQIIIYTGYCYDEFDNLVQYEDEYNAD